MPVQLPVHLLTGFLGSGKTTLLASLVRSPAFCDTAVIINEYGEIGLDHMLVGRGEEVNTRLLESGCLCCALNGSLQNTLETLYYDREGGKVPRFDRVVIETSGLADPGPIINTLQADRIIAAHFRLASIIVTVDALEGARHLAEFVEAEAQLAIADKIVVTKTDRATGDQRAAVHAELRRRNPHAQVFDAPLSEGSTAAMMLPPSPGMPRILGGRSVPAADRLGDRVQSVHTAGNVCSCTFEVESPVSWSAYAAWISHVQSALAGNLLRAKGLLMIDSRARYAIQGVGCVFAPPEQIDFPTDLPCHLTLIGRNVTAAQLSLTSMHLGGMS